MDFATLRAANLSRCARWHPRGLTEWSLSDWGVATAGEMGEALNVIKKLNRERDDIAGNTLTEEQLRIELADEIADVAIYLDIMAASEGIDLAQAIARKFNKTSVKVGFPERLPVGLLCDHCGAEDDTDNQPPSKRAREAAADFAGGSGQFGAAPPFLSESYIADMRKGRCDDGRFVQSFAQFERTLLDEIKARVRGLKRPERREPFTGFDISWNSAIETMLAAIDTIQGRE